MKTSFFALLALTSMQNAFAEESTMSVPRNMKNINVYNKGDAILFPEGFTFDKVHPYDKTLMTKELYESDELDSSGAKRFGSIGSSVHGESIGRKCTIQVKAQKLGEAVAVRLMKALLWKVDSPAHSDFVEFSNDYTNTKISIGCDGSADLEKILGKAKISIIPNPKNDLVPVTNMNYQREEPSGSQPEASLTAI